MARELNKVQFTGRLGADPEMRYTPQGHAVTIFRVASNRSWRSSDGNSHEDTEWFRVVAWNKLAEVCNEYLAKGLRVYVEGRLQTRQWRDQEGQTRYSTEVIANDMIILDSRRDATPSNEEETIETAPAALKRAPSHVTVSTPPSAAQLSAAPGRSSQAARIATLPRSKSAFKEEDLPF